jgi:hypothetical protein
MNPFRCVGFGSFPGIVDFSRMPGDCLQAKGFTIPRDREKAPRHWIKVKNPNYSQLDGREELFERV